MKIDSLYNGDHMNIEYNQILIVIIRSIISLSVLFMTTKIIGKKQVSQLSLFDYVIGISIGNFAAETIINPEIQFLNGIIAMIIFGLISYVVAILTMKSIKLRRFFNGTPTILIQNGKIIERSLKQVKFDINELLEECRSNGYFDIGEIEFALLEAKGTLSILPKGKYKPITIKDMNLKVKEQSLVSNIIIDGKIMKNNLENMNKEQKWLEKELKVKGYRNLKNILLATLDIDEKLTIYERNIQEKVMNVLE